MPYFTEKSTKSDVRVKGWHERCNSSSVILTFSDIVAHFVAKIDNFDILTRLKKLMKIKKNKKS